MPHRSLFLRPALFLAAFGAVVGCGSAQTSDASAAANAGAANSPLSWLSPDVKTAWDNGFKGKGVTITVVDSYQSESRMGNLTGTREWRSHGGWTSTQAQIVAPEAKINRVDYTTQAKTPYALASGLNVINNSYGIVDSPQAGFSSLDPLEQATVRHARNGTAVVVIAAGNDGTVIGAQVGGQKDVLVTQLIGAKSAVFAGALTSNGSTIAKANLADYSNFPGTNAAVQSNFLVVGVDSKTTNLSGTSYAAPIVSGYAAILGSKFTSATPTQITNQLLNTARTDTIQGYSPALHGKGEASLSRALAPNALQ